MSQRQKYNRLLIEEISAQIEAYPELRFHQILQNLGIVKLDVISEGDIDGRMLSSDRFYEESEVTYERVLKNRS